MEVFGNRDTASYEFTIPDTGDYYVKAALNASDTLYSDFIPTYYKKDAKWKKAKAINVSNASHRADIDLIMATNTTGRGFVSGKVSQGANKKGDPLGNIQVMLAGTDDTPLRYTYSKDDGTFTFENVAFGEYNVYAEIPGLIPVEASIKLDSSSSIVDNIDIQVSRATVVTSIRRQLQNSGIENITLYPNPADDRINLDIRSLKNSNATIEVYSVTGQTLLHMQTAIIEGQQTVKLPLDKLPSGMYLVKLITANGLWEQSFIKKN
jgi:hypothetical protein